MQRLVDSLEICFREGHAAVIETTDGTRLKFSDCFICKYDGTRYEEPEPHLFSFNSPFGACPTCQGFGNTIGIDYGLVIPNPLISLGAGAIEPFTRPQYAWAQKELYKYCQAASVDMKVPYADLPDYPAELHHLWRRRLARDQGDFLSGSRPRNTKLHVRVFLAKFRGYTRCPDCNGQRLRQPLATLRSAAVPCQRSSTCRFSDAHAFFEKLELTPERTQIADKILLEIRRRFKVSRRCWPRLPNPRPFGGDAVRAARHSGYSLPPILVRCWSERFMFSTNPSIGLHPRDNSRLIKILENLRDIGNTGSVVVEHDEETMRAADHIVDIGIHAGEHGGNVVYEGDFAGLLKNDVSLTAKYLRGDAEIKIPQRTPHHFS
jgi:excinuclease ABC subunit A